MQYHSTAMPSNTMTLFQFLEQAGAKVHAYDIGRRVGALPREQFLAFENAATPYPLPMQRKAWFALVQLPAAAPRDPVIWFLRLDLDEQGLLVQAERDYLLNRLLESAQAQTRGSDPQAFLQDNPYAFKPRDDRMALFHALLSAQLELPPSRFYQHALDYFSGKPGWDQWSFVGYQGIAEVACRHDGEPLTGAIGHLPAEPLVALCHCLESRVLGEPLRNALIMRLRQALGEDQPDIALLAALIRGLSASSRTTSVRRALAVVLAHPAANNIEILAAVSGRAWEALADTNLLQAYLQRLAGNDHGRTAFEHCIGDLLSLPSLAGPVRQALRSPDQSAEVLGAFSRMTTEADPTVAD
jgi:hypothetical protein